MNIREIPPPAPLINADLVLALEGFLAEAKLGTLHSLVGILKYEDGSVQRCFGMAEHDNVFTFVGYLRALERTMLDLLEQAGAD